MKVLLALTLLMSTQAFARPEISIPATVEISQRPLLRLGDVAVVKGANESLVAQIESIVIREDARELLISQKLEAKEVLTILKNEMENNEDFRNSKPAFRIPSVVKVEFAKSPVSRQEVERKITNYLTARCADCEYKITIQSTPNPANRAWDLDMSQLSTKGGFLLPVRDGDSRQIKWISGTIRVSKLTPVTTKLISQGERVNSQDLQMQMVDVTFAKDSGLRIEDANGQLAARALPVGTPVWASDLKREPAAKRGQIVKAIIGDDTFEVSVNVQAEDTGYIGDLIKVKNLETQKVLSAIIAEKGVVKLQ
ncbi:flagellar basal body P-ring formation chaperone FlgA [Bdellovibrio sp. KM01]|uniref:flagellar basal body P-ring formation chaperone FlgA n=1 Tax=Bdellovibrio sp. KM01 TaxID=2748865 RepID=UPI0015EA1486|nr:flagellar basal body P-ring formation chaperone FlgA [Bdellovibrio sp. KM01]QLY25921.1 flagellar basal body P-ring formation protein FlgA [Bdellovibrio sp. KM01]